MRLAQSGLREHCQLVLVIEFKCLRSPQVSKMKHATKELKPGQKAPASGQYQEVGPRGRLGHEVTVVKGEPLPPTTLAGSTYKLVDRSKNKSGQT